MAKKSEWNAFNSLSPLRRGEGGGVRISILISHFFSYANKVIIIKPRRNLRLIHPFDDLYLVIWSGNCGRRQKVNRNTSVIEH